MNIVDLRSDTVTHPTNLMREAMAKAEIGDDVMREDPTVNRLEEMAAERMGKEAGLFVASGTMGNLAAILTHCGRGDEVILGNLSHTFIFEAGGSAALGGVHSYVLPNQSDGSLQIGDIRAAYRTDDVHFPTSRLVVLENTHNRCGGVYLSPDYLKQVGELKEELGISLHMDGARIFNAAVASGRSAAELAKYADSITFCLSKGLCAPVGSVLCGSRKFVDKARRIRKQLGGGMRQAGFLAAAGIVALDTMVDRLADDHRRAKLLAQELARIPGIEPEMTPWSTNMVFAHLADNLPANAKEIAGKLTARDVKVGVTGERRFRLVTHYWVDDAAVERTVEAFSAVLASLATR